MSLQHAKSDRTGDGLGDALRQAADQDVPEFSEDLHRRIMTELDQFTVTKPNEARRGRARVQTLAIALTAVLCVVASGIVWFNNSEEQAVSRFAARDAVKATPPPAETEIVAQISVGEGVAWVFRCVDRHPIRHSHW